MTRRVDRPEGPRDEGMYTPKIQEDKKEKEKFAPLPEDKDKQILFATFFSYLKNLFDTFSPSKKIAGRVIDLQEIANNLAEFKKVLMRLEKEDLSNDAAFATELSTIWEKLVDDFHEIEVIKRKNMKEIAAFRKVMDTIKLYPVDSEHRLGYYLLEHAGQDWLPFPFIEILLRLHKDHEKEKNESTLSRWHILIDQAIEAIEMHLPFNP